MQFSDGQMARQRALDRGQDMPKGLEEGGITDIDDMDSDSYIALSRLLNYAAREAAAQNRFTTAKFIQAAIASLSDQAPMGDGPPCTLPAPGRC
jgi:hypothetical protein